MGLGVTSPLSAVRHQAVAELREVIARLNAGETPEALGLVVGDRGTSEAVDALIDGVNDPKAPLDAAMIEGLAPYERRYAVEFLSRALARGDERVTPLLEALDSPWAKLVLEAARTERSSPT